MIDTVDHNAKKRSSLAIKLKNPCQFSNQKGGIQDTAVIPKDCMVDFL